MGVRNHLLHSTPYWPSVPACLPTKLIPECFSKYFISSDTLILVRIFSKLTFTSALNITNLIGKYLFYIDWIFVRSIETQFP